MATTRQRGSGRARSRRGPPRARERLPDLAEYTLSRLEQVRVLADPLRVRILECLCRERTTKQVADLLGEKPTKLYHHVEALARVGLVRLSRTRRKRGTIEKYYLAVARAFRADSRLFATPSAAGQKALGTVIAGVLDNTARELQALVGAGASPGIEEEGVLGYLEIAAPAETIARLRGKLKRLVADVQKAGGAPAGSAAPRRRYRLTLAYFPLDAAEAKAGKGPAVESSGRGVGRRRPDHRSAGKRPPR